MKCSFDAANAKFVCDLESNAMLVEKEEIESICAYPPDGLIVSVKPTDLILVRNWKVISYISDPAPGNIFKHYQSVLPFFNIDECPFVVTSGDVGYNLVNV